MKYERIIWDWNGTLFDDVNWCFQILNGMLGRRSLRTLSDLEEYYTVFDFPIRDYYERVGFQFEQESFEILAEEYIRLYHGENSGNCKLHEGAEEVLQTICMKGVSQVILSASKYENLVRQVNSFPIGQYFDEILGISDIYAKSKLEIGMEYIRRSQPKKTVLIGDTVHDYEVAAALGVDCILLAKGHHSMEKLTACKVPVLSDILEVPAFVEK